MTATADLDAPTGTAAGRSRQVAALAFPLALTQLAQVALTTTDIVMMGALGAQALAAGGLAIVLFNQLRTMGVGLVTAVGNQVAAATANSDGRTDDVDSGAQVRELLRAGLAVATVAGLCGAALMLLAGQALPLLGQDPAVVAQARPMLAALAPGLVPCLWFQVIRQYTVGMRRPQALVWITVLSVGVNAGLNWALLTGVWIAPKLGLAGIGVATTSVYLMSAVALYLLVRRDAQLASQLTLRGWQATPGTVRRLLRLGAPIAATYGSEAGFFTVVALIIGNFGAAALAAHTVVNQLVYIVFQVTIGLSHAASILVSREVARGRIGAARQLGRTALRQGMAVMTVVAVLYLAAPHLVLRAFLNPNEVADRAALAVAGQLLVAAAVLQFFDCAQNIGVGLLRGLDDTVGGFKVTLLGYWAVGLPAAWLGAQLSQGPVGVWLGLITGLAVTAGLLLARFARQLNERLGAARPPE